MVCVPLGFDGFEVGPPLAGADGFVLFEGVGLGVAECVAVGVPEADADAEEEVDPVGTQWVSVGTELAEAARELAVPAASAPEPPVALALAVAEASPVEPPPGPALADEGEPGGAAGFEHTGVETVPEAAAAGSDITVP